MVYAGAGGVRVLAGMPPGPATTTSTQLTSTTSTPVSTTRPPVTTTTVPAPNGGQTTAFQIDAAHSGSLRSGTQRPPLTKRWSLDLGGTISFPLIANGTVFALANTAHSYSQSTLFAVDAATGKTVWGPLDAGRFATYTYGAGQIFLVNRDGTVRSIDAATGRTRWMTRITAQHLFEAPPAYRDGIIYVSGSGSGATLFALSATDGHQLWAGHLSIGGTASPAVGADLIYTSEACPPAVARDPITGQDAWRVSWNCAGFGGLTPVLADGLLWVRGIPSRLPGAYDARTGARFVTFTADEAPAFDGPIGYFLVGGALEAREARTQTTRWSFSGDGRLTSAPIVVNGFVYAASASGQVWALDGETGEVAWSENAGAPVLPPGPVPGMGTDPLTGLGAGQGLVVVPASNLLVAYAPVGSTPASAAVPPRIPPATSATKPTPVAQAGNYRMDASARAWVEGGPAAPPLWTRWARELGAHPEYAVAGDGKVFVGAGDRLFALDAATGEDAWPPVTFVTLLLRVTYGDGRVFAVPRSGAVRAFDAATGKELWSRELGSSISSAPTYSQGILYVVNDGQTFALSAGTGRVLWQRALGHSYRSPPAVSGDVLYPSDVCVRATNALTGEQKWQGGDSACERRDVGTPVAADGRLWQEGTGFDTPTIRNTATGAVIAGFGGTVPALDGTRAYLLDGYAVKAKDPVTQFTLWTFAPADRPATPPVVIDGYVYVASQSGRLWALDPATGVPVWSGDAAGAIPYGHNLDNIGTNITAGPGVVLVPTGNRLVAYEAVTPPKPAPLPQPAAFGWNLFGALGDGTNSTRPSPVPAGLTGVVEVSAGVYHTLGRKADGTVWAWGWNGVGQIGDGTMASRAAPVKVQGLTNVVSVSAGAYHSLAVTADGSVWSWGWNALGQLGDGTRTDRLNPVKVAGLAGVATASGGGAHSTAVGRDGSLSSWGWNGVGQLGVGTTTDHLRPVTVPGLAGMSSVSAGWYQTTAVRGDGTVWGWGWNAFTQLGDGTTIDRRSPVRVPGLANVVAVSNGLYHGLAVHDDGTVSGWGWNGYGQIGDGSTAHRRSPVKVPGLRGVTSVSAGAVHSLARLGDGTVVSWGLNHVGQLGDGTLTDRAAPRPVPSLSGVESLAAGAFHGVAVGG